MDADTWYKSRLSGPSADYLADFLEVPSGVYFSYICQKMVSKARE